MPNKKSENVRSFRYCTLLNPLLEPEARRWLMVGLTVTSISPLCQADFDSLQTTIVRCPNMRLLDTLCAGSLTFEGGTGDPAERVCIYVHTYLRAREERGPGAGPEQAPAL